MAENYIVKSEELKQIADAIREKAGISDNLTFPTAMVEAITAIETGGGNELYSGVKYATGIITPSEDTTNLRIDNPFVEFDRVVFACVYLENDVDRTTSNMAKLIAGQYTSSNRGYGAVVGTWGNDVAKFTDSTETTGERMLISYNFMNGQIYFDFITGISWPFKSGITYRWIFLVK